MQILKKTFFIWTLACSQGMAQTPTFVKDVAPIIHAKCSPCHRPNEAAPFSLISYEDVAKRASFIKTVISSGYMPPWKPDKHYAEYSNNRSLTDKEKATLLAWIDNKAPRGEGEIKAARTQEMVRVRTAYHRTPDTSLMMPQPFKLPGDNYERFVMYRIPFDLKDSANIEAIEFHTDNKRVIHHVNYSIHAVPDGVPLNSGPDMVNLAEEDPALTDQWKPLKKTIEYYGGWIPGASFESYPKGMGWVLPKRGVIILTLHFAPVAKPEECTAGVNLFFTKNKIDRKVKVISFGSGGIGEQQIKPPLKLLPNQVRTFTLELTNPGEDFSVMYVWPHMHLLGKEYKAFAISPAGDTIRLAHIPDWDFRWQEIYRFKKLVPVPRGSRLVIQGTYDNTTNNPFNPYNPPRMIYSSGNMETTNEMLTLLMVFLPYRKGDENLVLEVPK
jgi:hypothetical protein